MHLMTVPTRVLAALFSMTLAIALVPTASLAQEDDDSTDDDPSAAGQCPEGYDKIDYSDGEDWTADDDYDEVILVGGPPEGEDNKDEDGRNKTFSDVSEGDTISREEHDISHICVIAGTEAQEPENGGGEDNGIEDDNDDEATEPDEDDEAVEEDDEAAEEDDEAAEEDDEAAEDDDVTAEEDDDVTTEDDDDVTPEEDDDVTPEEDDDVTTEDDDDVTAEDDAVEEDGDDVVTPERVDAGGGGLTDATTASPALMAMLALGLGAVGGGAAWRLRRTPTA